MVRTSQSGLARMGDSVKLQTAMLFVSDLDRMADFYTRIMGFTPINRTADWIGLHTGECRLALHVIPPEHRATSTGAPREQAPLRLDFGVADVDGEAARLEALGVQIITRSWGATDILDPEGNILGLRPLPSASAASPALPSSFIQPFVPAKDFDLSKRFYLALDFKLRFEAEKIAGFDHESGAFLLQDYYVKEWAENFMMSWGVRDLDAWFRNVEALDLPGRFGVRAPTPPKLQPWGLVISYLVDPSGVLWHVSQRPDAKA